VARSPNAIALEDPETQTEPQIPAGSRVAPGSGPHGADGLRLENPTPPPLAAGEHHARQPRQIRHRGKQPVAGGSPTAKRGAGALRPS